MAETQVRPTYALTQFQLKLDSYTRVTNCTGLEGMPSELFGRRFHALGCQVGAIDIGNALRTGQRHRYAHLAGNQLE